MTLPLMEALIALYQKAKVWKRFGLVVRTLGIKGMINLLVFGLPLPILKKLIVCDKNLNIFYSDGKLTLAYPRYK